MRFVRPSFIVETPTDRLGLGVLRALESAGRTCYKSEEAITDESATDFIGNKILPTGHHSVIEHEHVRVRIICDRGVSHEIVRHRLASYSQESTRFCNYSKDKFNGQIAYIETPWELGEDDLELLAAIEKHYMKKIEQGWTAQQARYFLPQGLKTEIVMTANLREWRHFFKERAVNPKAHPQMREIAIPMLEEFKRFIPIIFDDIIVKDRSDFLKEERK